MKDKILVETKRIKEIMGIKSQIISEIRIPANIIRGLRNTALNFLSYNDENFVRNAFPSLRNVPNLTMDDIIDAIDGTDLTSKQLTALLKTNNRPLKNSVIDIITDDSDVLNMVDNLTAAIRDGRSSEANIYKKQLKQLFDFDLDDTELDEVINNAENKIKNINDDNQKVAQRRVKIRQDLENIEKSLDNLKLDSKSLRELFKGKDEATARKILSDRKKEFDILKKDPEFEEAISFVVGNKDFNDIVSKIGATLKANYPSVYSRIWYGNYNKIVAGIIAITLIKGFGEEFKKDGAFYAVTLFWKSLFGWGESKKYTQDKVGFHEFLRDNKINFEPETADMSPVAGFWSSDLLSQSSNLYRYVDGTFVSK